MPRSLEHEPYLKPLSPASSDTSVSSNTHATPPRGPQRDFIYPRPVQSLPPLRAFLRDEGIDTAIEPRQPRFISATHEVAREEARRRALRGTATRYHDRPNSYFGYGLRNTSTNAQPTIPPPLDEVRRPGYNRRNRDCGEFAPYQRVVRRSISSSSTAADDRHARKTIPTLRPYVSRFGTVEERMSREVETFVQPLPSAPSTVADSSVSPIPSRKRARPTYLEQSDDEDSEGDGSGGPGVRIVPRTGRSRPPSVQDDVDELETSDSDTRETRDEKEQRDSPRILGKPSGRHKSERGLDKGPEHEYFSPSGIKLEVIELPVKYDTKEWLKHVEQCPNGSKAPWRCTWQTMKNGSPMPCDYSSKKHLVKRHIEATHLCIKRFQCTWCEKTFTQRSNVAGCHLNTHTGASPHGCDFCGDRFKDPSKRHKHMLRIHGYRPGESRKKFRSEESAQGQSVHESLEPWKVADTREA